MFREFDVLEPELLFTRTYREYRDRPKVQRELACLRTQQSYMLQRIKPYQKLCGYAEYFAVGLHHVMYGDGPTAGVDKVGFCYDKDRIQKKLESYVFSPERRREIEEMCAFWDMEYTNYKARKAFDAEMQAAAPSDNWMTESAVVHPLYRIAEFQLDYKKLITLGISGLRREIGTYLVNFE